MTDISLTSVDYATNDMSWLGSAHGTEATETGTLDVSAFTLGSHYPNGYFPSGLGLAKITASGKWGPAEGATTSEVQLLTRTSTGGTVTLTVDGETTADIAASAAGFTAAAVQAATDALSNTAAGDITWSGSAGGPLTATFGGKWAGSNQPAIVVDNTSATGGTIVDSTTTAGSAGSDDPDRGHLFGSVKFPTSGNDVGCAVFTHGKVREANLPAHSGVDAAFKAAVAGSIRYI